MYRRCISTPPPATATMAYVAEQRRAEHRRQQVGRVDVDADDREAGRRGKYFATSGTELGRMPSAAAPFPYALSDGGRGSGSQSP